MPSAFGFNFPPPEDPNKKWNIGGTNDLGFSSGYGDEIKRALDNVYQNQYSESMNMGQENALASGSFNPNLSSYYASKGAREAQQTGKVAALGAARDDEYKRFGVMNSINNFNLQDKALNEQIRAAQAAEPGFWDDLFGGISAVSGALPFFSEGGAVNADVMKAFLDAAMKHYANGGAINSETIQDIFGGWIPPEAANTAPASTGDNVMIMAKDGERIIRPEGDKMTFGATQMINDSVEMIKSLIN